MEFLNFLLAVSPIVVVLAGILVMKKPAMKVAPVALIWTTIPALTNVNNKGLAYKENVAVMEDKQ